MFLYDTAAGSVPYVPYCLIKVFLAGFCEFTFKWSWVTAPIESGVELF